MNMGVIVKTFIGILLLGIGLSGTAVANDHDPWPWRDHHHMGAPEIDPASGASALALLAGALLMLRGRRKMKADSF